VTVGDERIDGPDPKEAGKRPSRLILAVQVAGSLMVLGIVFTTLSSPGDVLKFLRAADLPAFLAAALLVFLSEGVSAFKWWLLIRQTGTPIPFGSVLRIYWIGMFYGTYLPGSVSGDAARVLLTRREVGLTAAAAAVFMQRNTGLAAMLALAGMFSILAPVNLGLFPGQIAWLNHPLVWFAGAICGYLFANLILVVPGGAETAHRMGTKLLPPRFHAGFSRLFHSACRGRGLIRHYWRRLTVPLLLSIGTQILDGAVIIVLAHSLGFAPNPLAAYQAMAAASLAGMLPVTINGIGVREVGFGLMLQAGVQSSQAVALGLLTTGLYLACALPGVGLHGRALLRKATSAPQAP
jgi:uncharacterized protein (TIRG00374 family)